MHNWITKSIRVYNKSINSYFSENTAKKFLHSKNIVCFFILTSFALALKLLSLSQHSEKTTLIISCMLHCVLLTFPLCHHFHSVLSKLLQSSYLHCCFHLCLLAICLLPLMAILWATDSQFLIKNQATSENQTLSVSLFILFMFLLDLHHFFKAKASCHFKTSNVLWLWSKTEKSVIKWNGMVFSEEILIMN